MKNIGLGTLALSGKYNTLSSQELKKQLKEIDHQKINFIDWGYVYSENGNDILNLISKNNDWKFKRLNLKILRLEPITLRETINQIEHSLNQGWRGPIEIMFHNPNEDNAVIYKEIIPIIKKEFPYYFFNFGICLFSLKQLKTFIKIKDLRTIQIPFNLVDAKEFYPILKLSKIYGLKTQVRSILGGGLFSGFKKLDDKSNFDSIRSNWKSSNLKYYDRFKKFLDIQSNFKKISPKKNTIALMYSFIMNIDDIDEVICGGSIAKQINHFSDFFALKENKNIYIEYLKIK